jgi:hypothetical protein
MPMPRCAVALRSRFQNGKVAAWQGNGMGAAYKRLGMCELALRLLSDFHEITGFVYKRISRKRKFRVT